MEKGDDRKKPPAGPASDGIAAATASSSSSPYASVNDDAMRLEEARIPASIRHSQHTDNLNALSQALSSRAYAVDSRVGIPSHFDQTHYGNAPPYSIFPPGAGAAGALSGPAGPPPCHASKRTRQPSSPPSASESLLLGGSPASQQQQSLANTLLYMSQQGATSSTRLPLPSFAAAPDDYQQDQLNITFTTINAEKPLDQVLLPRPQILRSGPVPDSPAQGLHTKQTTGPHNGLINGYVPQALDSSAPLMVPPIGYQIPSRDDQKQDEIFIPYNNDVIVGGRGHETSVHPGNEKYRKLIDSIKEPYWNSCKRDKPHVSAGIVRAVRAQNPPGRFLQRKDAKGLWFDVGDVKAREKISHALREGISESKTSVGGSKLFIGKFLHHHHHHQANSNSKVSRGEETSAGDMEQDEHAGLQRATSLTANKNVGTSNRRPLVSSSVPGVSAAGSSSDPTGRSPERAQAISRGETRSKTASLSAATKASEGHHPASSAASSSSGKRKRGRPPGSKTKKRHRRFLIEGTVSNLPPPTVPPPPTQYFVPPVSLPPILPPPTTAPDQFMNAAADRRMVEVRHSSVASEERTHAHNFSGNRTEPLKKVLPPPMAHATHPRPLPPPTVTPTTSDSSDFELRLSFADHLTNSSCSGNLSEHLQQQRASKDRYFMAGLLGLDPYEVTEALGSGKTEEEVIDGHLKDAGEDRTADSSATVEKQKRRVVNAERLHAEMSFTDPKKPLERRISTALFSIGFVNEKK